MLSAPFLHAVPQVFWVFQLYCHILNSLSTLPAIHHISVYKLFLITTFFGSYQKRLLCEPLEAVRWKLDVSRMVVDLYLICQMVDHLEQDALTLSGSLIIARSQNVQWYATLGLDAPLWSA